MLLGSRRGSTVFSRYSAIVLLLLANGLAGCGDSASSTPSEPSAQSNPTLEVFTDWATGFSTSDLRDSQEQILQLTRAGEFVWTADGTRLPGYSVSYPTPDGRVSFIEGKICPEWCAFEVRFGTRDGERRAYLTVDHGHWNPGTLVDVEVAGGALVVTETELYPPGTFTLSGVVTERTSRGPAPVEGAEVWRLVTTGWRFAATDADGFYRIPGLYDGTARVNTSKEGYEEDERAVTIHGDTRHDVELVRR